MTVQVGRNDIKLGWETGAAIVLFLVTTMFGAGMYVSKFLAKQDEIYSYVKTVAKHDSVTANNIIALKVTVDSLKRINVPVVAYNRPKRKGKFYIERRINGKLQIIEVDNPNDIQ